MIRTIFSYLGVVILSIVFIIMLPCGTLLILNGSATLDISTWWKASTATVEAAILPALNEYPLLKHIGMAIHALMSAGAGIEGLPQWMGNVAAGILNVDPTGQSVWIDVLSDLNVVVWMTCVTRVELSIVAGFARIFAGGRSIFRVGVLTGFDVAVNVSLCLVVCNLILRAGTCGILLLLALLAAGILLLAGEVNVAKAGLPLQAKNKPKATAIGAKFFESFSFGKFMVSLFDTVIDTCSTFLLIFSFNVMSTMRPAPSFITAGMLSAAASKMDAFLFPRVNKYVKKLGFLLIAFGLIYTGKWLFG